MGEDLTQTIAVAASGMKVQTARLKVIAQNIANANSVSPAAGEDPYRRKIISFENVLDKELGVELVKVREIDEDKAPFGNKYDPTHPAADENGVVFTTNVNRTLEAADMREAQRTYEANLSTIDITKAMLTKTLEMLR